MRGKPAAEFPVVEEAPGESSTDLHTVLPYCFQRFAQEAEVVLTPGGIEQLVSELSVCFIVYWKSELGNHDGMSPCIVEIAEVAP